MKNKDLFTFRQGLEKAKELKGVKFAYAVSKNYKLVNTEIEVLQETIKPSEKYKEFEEKRNELIKQCSSLNDNGTPKSKKEMVNGVEMESYDIQDMETFNKEFELLQAEYSVTLTERMSQMEEYTKLLEEEIEEGTLIFRNIVLENVPDEIDCETMGLIDWMVIEA